MSWRRDGFERNRRTPYLLEGTGTPARVGTTFLERYITLHYVPSRIRSAAVALTLIAAACTSGADPTTTVTEPPPTTVTVAPSTSTAAPTTTTEVPPPSTTSTTEGHQELTIEEAEALILDLEVGRLHAVWAKDQVALWDIVATTTQHDGGVEAFETLVFLAEPSPDLVTVEVVVIPLDRPDCRVIGYILETNGLLDDGDFRFEGIDVLWPDDDDTWRIATVWGGGTPEEFWLADCDVLEREVTP